MDTVITGLYASPPEPVPFGPSLAIRAFLLQRDQGNLLVYRAETLKRDVAVVNDLGGVFRQYLNHRHEAAPACDWVAETFGAPLFCHVSEARSVSAGCNVGETFSERHRLDDDFEVIPTPDTRAGPLPTCGTRASIAACSPATRSSSPAASGGRSCSAPTRRPRSTESAIESCTSRVSS